MSSAPDLRSLARRVRTAGRQDLISILSELRMSKDDYLRRAITQHRRFDILAAEVIGHDVEPLHRAILRHHARHPKSLTMTLRGAGKTTIGTVDDIIGMLATNRDLRILIASKTKTNAEAMLKEIKGHLEHNTKLIDLFGPFFDSRKTTKWDTSEIDILGKTKITKEASISCAGFDSAVVSKHYDVHFPDDLVDDTNSATVHMRNKLHRWYYQSLVPTLEPPDPAVRFRGEEHVQGTHYHFADIYTHFRAHDFRNATLVIPALDAHGRSALPKKFPSAFLRNLRQHMGTILFNAQYQCDTEAMKGEIFTLDQCQRVYREAFPPRQKLYVFAAADLAIPEESKNDQFAIVVLGFTSLDEKAEIYVLDYYADRIRFGRQTDKIVEVFKTWDPIRFGIESNAYQKAQYHQLVDSGRVPPGRLLPINTDKDKITRAWKLSAEFEAKRVFFPIDEIGRGKSFGPMIDQFVMFPNFPLKDLFDAFDFCVRTKRHRMRARRRGRTAEPGVL